MPGGSLGLLDSDSHVLTLGPGEAQVAMAKGARRPSRPGPPQLPLPVSGRPTLEAEWAPLPESSDRCVEPKSPPPRRPSEGPGSSSSESWAKPPSSSGSPLAAPLGSPWLWGS